jgi:hypothetical protein
MADGQKSMIPSATDEELLQQARIARLSHSPAAAAMNLRMNIDVDVRDVLASIRVPIRQMQSASSPPFYSPTSSTRRHAPLSLATAPGVSSCSNTTR